MKKNHKKHIQKLCEQYHECVEIEKKLFTSSWSCPVGGRPKRILPCRAKLARRVKLVRVVSRSLKCSILVRSLIILLKIALSSTTPTKKSSIRSLRVLRFFMAFKFLSASNSSPDFPGKNTFKSPWIRHGEKSLYLWWRSEQIFFFF